MAYPLKFRMPIIKVKIRIGPVTLKHLESHYSSNLEVWPRSQLKEIKIEFAILWTL